MDETPKWVLVSSGAAPVLLVGGWAIGAALQPASYDPVRDTISALAAVGATDRLVMTSALAGLGICHLVTTSGLRSAKWPGRLLLGAGGIATMLVAAFPQPEVGNSVAHSVAATISFTALGAWPLLASRQLPTAPLLRRSSSRAAAIVLLGLSAWFAGELHGDFRGLSERAAATAQALWPLAVAISARRAFANGHLVKTPTS